MMIPTAMLRSLSANVATCAANLLTPAELARVQAADWPGCEEENPDAWRHTVITLSDLSLWMRESGYGGTA